MSSRAPSTGLPTIIQGGMGVGVSGWQLARAVSVTGQLGVVSGTALDVVHARRLGDGDPGGELHRAYAAFPVPSIAERVLDRWFIDGGKEPDEAYRPVPMFDTRPVRARQALTILANFAEVWLAKDGHGGKVGINFLEKIQIPTPHAVYGAMLAGVDAVLVGAGIPTALPNLLDRLSRGDRVAYRVDVEGDTGTTEVHLDPAEWVPPDPSSAVGSRLDRPAFLAIVGSHTLAAYLAKDPDTRPDGFVVEAPVAGGHNAPPRGRMTLDDSGQPVYGSRDVVDLDKMAALDLPFWLAGGHGRPGGLPAALAAGASGIQVGTAFALCAESGMSPALRDAAVRRALDGELTITTDPYASPSGYPFKIADIEGTLSDPERHEARRRVCDLGFLRTAYERPDGSTGFRCPSEPVEHFIAKGGRPGEPEGRMCLCNGLMATIGLPQVRAEGTEPALVTLGDDAPAVVQALTAGIGPRPWPATEVVQLLLGEG